MWIHAGKKLAKKIVQNFCINQFLLPLPSQKTGYSSMSFILGSSKNDFYKPK